MADNWEPINTAPKDRTAVLLKSEGFSPATPMYWSKEHQEWMGIALGYFGPMAVIWSKEVEQPTHWRPLDLLVAPPQLAEGEA